MLTEQKNGKTLSAGWYCSVAELTSSETALPLEFLSWMLLSITVVWATRESGGLAFRKYPKLFAFHDYVSWCPLQQKLGDKLGSSSKMHSYDICKGELRWKLFSDGLAVFWKQVWRCWDFCNNVKSHWLVSGLPRGHYSLIPHFLDSDRCHSSLVNQFFGVILESFLETQVWPSSTSSSHDTISTKFLTLNLFLFKITRVVSVS